MGDVLRTSVELPTIVFTAMLAIVAVLWVLSLIGALDFESDAADGALGEALDQFDLAEVPATILLTLLALTGWFVSVLASIFLLDSRSGTALLILSIVVGLGAAVVGVGATVVIGPALGRVFETAYAPDKGDLLGRTVEIRSQTVTHTSGRGEATWPDGTVSTIDIRTVDGSDIAPGELRKGDRALLVDWIETTDDFIIGQLPAELAN